MRLKNYTNYALRTLQMAALRAPALTQVDQVATAHGISRAHIMKIVHELGRAGYVETVRGRGGGFRLARDPAEITLGEVVRLTEAPIELVECFNDDTNSCPLIGICRLSTALDAALEAFLQVLDGITVTDLAGNRRDLVARLGPVAEAPAPEPTG
ncbi:RrF2 family transcriptional regulator [Rhodovibrio salinarum]|uniref:Rrf2 family transcriptional regulator n=1 Tax=Rhodovibrio salinarum TaxID=1087 RepID=A0A934UYV2_9PROT|nr:Rrf2 family transcriptional regulator [Rhodovibrio salinarum]MBK1695801.1 Rrf2 family transcriptional regulator [Rhodovibrio salinarum]